MDSVRDRAAVVTGGAGGIGLAIARALLHGGASVTLVDVDQRALDTALADLDEPLASSAVVDVADRHAMQELAAELDDRHGGTDILVNNAGVSCKGAVWELSAGDWQWVLDVCLWGTINGIAAFVPAMVARGRAAHVVNTGSMMSFGSAPYGGPYQVAKQGVAAISETLQFELAERAPHVGVTLLCPGYTATNIGTSDRTRSSRYGGAAPTPGRPSQRHDVTRADPAAIADITIEAILSGRFYALADWDAWRPVVHERFDAIVRQDQPVPVVLS